MGKSYNWHKLLEKTWLYTKIFFVVLALCVAAYAYGTYNPNKTAKAVVNEELDLFYMKKIEEMDLQEPEFTYHNDIQFIRAMHKCINYINFTLPKDQRVPYEMIIGQAALESGWGTSRFALEANNLFGIRVFKSTAPHLLPLGVEKWQGWGVRVFKTKCDSVKEYIRLLNEHPAYEDFRTMRAKMLATNQPLDSIKLIKTLKAVSYTHLTLPTMR